MIRVLTESEFRAYCERRAEKLKMIAEGKAQRDTSDKVNTAKQDLKMLGAKNSIGNSAPNADWTKGKKAAGAKKNVDIKGEERPEPTGGVQKARAKSTDFLDGKKGEKVEKKKFTK